MRALVAGSRRSVGRFERVREVESGPPPWWRENWWAPLLLLLLFVGLLIAFIVFRGDDAESAGDRVSVPDVVGLEEAEARERIEGAGLDAAVDEVASADAAGDVVAQEPGAGAQLERGEEVLLTVSAGSAETDTTTETEPTTVTDTVTETETTEPEIVAVPGVGSDHADAGATVEERGLVPDTYPVDSQEPRGTVVAQNPPEGTDARRGSNVRLNVSLGEGERPGAEVPDVTGLAAGEARQRLRDAGFTVRTLDRDAPEPDNVGEVILQRPEPRTAPVLTQVTIYVGR